MKKKSLIFGVGLAITGLVFNMISPNNVLALTTTQLAVSNTGSQASIGNDFSMTPDGKYVLFQSNKNYLVDDDNNNKQDVFVRNTENESTTRISVSSSGTEANNTSTPIKITNNGRYVLFYSTSTNLVNTAGLAGYTHGIFLHDNKTEETILIDWGSYIGATNTTTDVQGGSMSEDARFIYYMKAVSTDWRHRIHKKDRLLNSTEVIDNNTLGLPQNTGYSGSVNTSCDGRFIVFQSSATDIVNDDNNNEYDVFLADTVDTNSIQNITLTGDAESTVPSISCDGNYVLFHSFASNLVNNDTNNTSDLFIYNVSQKSLEKGALADGGIEISGYVSGRRALSDDGRYLAFEARPNSQSDKQQIYIRDLRTNTTKLVSQNSSNQVGDQDSSLTGMTYDGKAIIYQSMAANLGQSNVNNDIFLFKATDY